MKQQKQLNIIQRARAGKSALTNKAHSLTRCSGWGGFFLPQFERFPGKQRRALKLQLGSTVAWGRKIYFELSLSERRL